MDISLSSSLNGSKLLLRSPPSHNLQGPRKFNVVSCRAAKLAGEKETTNFYKLFSLHAGNVGADEIKRAYRTMALQYHPDVCHPSRKEESTQMFVELHRAYKTLSDPMSREQYDYELGLSKFERIYKSEAGGLSRERWEDQLCELRKKSDNRMARKEGSWGSRLRSQRK